MGTHLTKALFRPYEPVVFGIQNEKMRLKAIKKLLANAVLLAVFIIVPSAQALTAPTPSLSPSPTPEILDGWRYHNRERYSFMIPARWKIGYDKNDLTVLIPGRAMGTLQEIAIRTLPDIRVREDRPFATQEEFDRNYEVDTVIEGKVRKIENVEVDGRRGIMYTDVGSGPQNWHIVVWIRDDEENIYLNFKGFDRQILDDGKAIDYFLSTFIF